MDEQTDAGPRYVLIAQDLVLSYFTALCVALIVTARFWSLAPKAIVVVPPIAIILAVVIRVPSLVMRWNEASSLSSAPQQFRMIKFLGPILGVIGGGQATLLVPYAGEADLLVLDSALMIASIIGGLCLSSVPTACYAIAFFSAIPVVLAAFYHGNPAAFWLAGINFSALFLTYGLSYRQKSQTDRLGEALAQAARVTEADAARRVAETADRAKSDFLATMSHEIRTPMNGVIGMAELLQETDLDERQAELTSIIAGSGTTLLAIINDILDFSKIEAGKLTFAPAPFNLRDAFENVCDLVSPRLRDKDVDLYLDYGPDLPDGIVGDAPRLKQVVTNLLGNAVKFTDHGHVVLRVRGEVADGALDLLVEVEDTGPGIPSEELPRMFRKFEQIVGGTTRSRDGTGLGLSISQGIVEGMGGEIGARSEVGQGATFWFRCRFALDAAQESGCADDVASLAAMRLLVVGAPPVLRDILEEQFRGWGMTGTVFGRDADLAPPAASGGRFDAILVDGMREAGTAGSHAAVTTALGGSAIPVIVMCRQFERECGARPGTARSVDRSVRALEMKAALLGTRRDRPRLVEPAATRTRAATSGTTPERTARPMILIAEDNAMNQRIITLMLKGFAVDHCIASNGREALEMIRSRPIDLLLTDISMPDLDGFDLVAAIRAAEAQRRDAALPVIAVTAHALSETRQRCLAAGMNDVITKPICRVDLLRTLDTWLPDRYRGAA